MAPMGGGGTGTPWASGLGCSGIGSGFQNVHLDKAMYVQWR